MNAPTGVGLARLLTLWGPLLSKIWAVVGPLVGVMLGTYLTLRIQKQRWVLDNKKEEYRELLSALTESFHTILGLAPMSARSTEEQRESLQAHWKAMTVINDRIFITDEIRKLDVMNRWKTAFHEFETGWPERPDYANTFAKAFGKLASDILKAAKSITR